MSILQKCIIDRCKIYIEYNIKLMWLKAEYIFPFRQNTTQEWNYKHDFQYKYTEREHTIIKPIY